MKQKTPPFPPPREETLRQAIMDMLEDQEVTPLEISEGIGLAEKEVYGHLEHIRHSLHRQGRSLTVVPATCRGCGFAFTKRERLKRPGRCPVCHGQSISQPRYRID